MINSHENFKAAVWSDLENKKIDQLKHTLNRAEDVFILDILNELPPQELVIVYRLLYKEKALSIFEALDTWVQEKLFHSFTEEKAIELIEELAPDDRVRLLDELPAKVTKNLLRSLSPEERRMTNLLMGFEPETAGRIMTPEYLRLKRDMTARKALEVVKEGAKEKETIYTLYITDDQRHLEGVLSLRDLLIADPEVKLESLMQQAIKVSTDADQEEVARLLQDLDLLAIPVTDKENRLVGIITVDDAMDILEDEATDDIFSTVGMPDVNKKENMRSAVLIEGSVLQIWKVRLPFLLLAMIGGMLAGTVIHNFEEMLESVAAVAVFIPVIMDMGGNVGSQSSTVFTRGLILGQIQLKNFWKHVLKEVFVGASMGVVIGILAGLVAFFWHGNAALGLSVGLALVAAMTLASFLGYVIPFILMKLDVDQVAGTAAIITTIKDVAGLFIYFFFVYLFMGIF